MAKATATFDANDSPIQAAFRRIDKSLVGMQAKFAHVALSAAKMLALPSVAAGAMAVGIKQALDVGGELNDLSARTGVAAGELLKLQQEFKNSGKAAEDVGPVINKMQKALASGTGSETLSKLGLKMDDLKKKTPVDQFHAIGEAINRVSDPAEKSAASMDIFGKSGGELLSLFASGGFGDAAAQVGGQAELLSKDAALFDDVSDKLALAGLKTQGFFVGVADKVAPVIKPLLDGLANLDFSQMGQQLGEVMSFIMQAFADGKIGDILFTSLKISLMDAGNFLMDVIRGAGNALAQSVAEAVKNGIMYFEVLSDPSFWKGMGEAFIGIAKDFTAILFDAVALILDKLSKIPGLGGKIGGAADSLREKAQGMRETGQAYRADAGDLLAPIAGKIAERAVEQTKNIGAAFKEGFGGSKAFNSSEDQAHLASIWAGVASHVQQISEKALADAAPKTPGDGTDELGMSNAKIGVNSLQRIGGGGGTGAGSGRDPILSENERQTGVLNKIYDKISNPPKKPGSVPVFG